MTNLEKRIITVTAQLQYLQQEKYLIKEKIDTTLRDISRLTKSIRKAEEEIRNAKEKFVGKYAIDCCEGDTSNSYNEKGEY